MKNEQQRQRQTTRCWYGTRCLTPGPVGLAQTAAPGPRSLYAQPGNRHSGMAFRKKTILLLGSLAILATFFLAGCDLEQFASDSQTISRATRKASPLIPPQWRYLATAISGITAAAAAVATAVQQWRIKLKLKNAIKAKAAQINRARTAGAAETAAAADRMIAFMKADQASLSNNPGESLLLFDLVRKGIR